MSPPPLRAWTSTESEGWAPEQRFPIQCQTASHPSTRWSPSAARSEDEGLNLALSVSNNMSPLFLMSFKLTYFPFVSFGAHRQYMASGQNDLPFVGLLDSTESCQWFLLQPEKKTETYFFDKWSRSVICDSVTFFFAACLWDCERYIFTSECSLRP